MHDHVEWPPRFQMASSVWPGVAKLGEECTELAQLVFKIVGTAGTMEFMDGTRVDPARLIEEMGDVEAALEFVKRHALTSVERYAVERRKASKLVTFETWRVTEASRG